jgi:hypothetical protein
MDYHRTPVLNQMDVISQQLEKSGYAVVPDVVGIGEITEIARFVDDHVNTRAGTRRLIDLPWCGELANRLAHEIRLSKALPIDTRAVQCTLFAKCVANNWLVALHQDLSLPVRV